MYGDFKKNLRTELDYQDLTVKELGARTAIPKATLDCYLGMRTSMPPADVAVRIATALGVTVEYLVTGVMRGPSGDMTNYLRFREVLDDLLVLPEQALNPIRVMIKVAAEQERKKVAQV
jgi:transcriptional regulator with XRE-family HTH domain